MEQQEEFHQLQRLYPINLCRNNIKSHKIWSYSKIKTIRKANGFPGSCQDRLFSDQSGY